MNKLDIAQIEAEYKSAINLGDYEWAQTLIEKLHDAGETEKVSELLEWLCQQPEPE